jgi:hypothetical protein
MPPVKPATTVSSAESDVEAKPKSGLWLALANLSISRPVTDRGGERMADIVHKGETVALTEEQAHGFLHRHRVPVIRPAKEQNTPAPDIKARDLFGERAPAQAFGARPDPADASKVIVNEAVPDPSDPRNAPEAHDPQTDLSVDPDAAKDR